MKCSRQYFQFLLRALFLSACCLVSAEKSWAVACNAIFSNGIQATSSTGNITLKYQSAITGGSATLATKTLTDNTSWLACSGSSCTASGTAAPTSSVTFQASTGVNGNISVAYLTSQTVNPGNYGTVNLASESTLNFSTNAGVFKMGAVTTSYKSVMSFVPGDYWINGNLTLADSTVLKRANASGSVRIFVNGNITLGYKITTDQFTPEQLLIVATGSISQGATNNQDHVISGFIYAGGNVSLGFNSTINGAVSGANFTGTGDQVKVNYSSASLAALGTKFSFEPFCSVGTTAPPVCTTGLIGGLMGDYFNNRTLTGSPTGTRTDNSVNFDWSTGATGVSGIGVDSFSVRWTGSLRAPSTGAYKFQTESDDGVRLWVNNVLVIDNWNDHGVTTNTSASINLVAGQSYPVRLEFYENGGFAVMKLNWSQPTNSSFTAIGTQVGVVPDTSAFCAVPVPTCDNGFIGGATGKYYNNISLTGSPAVTRLDSAIDFDWGSGSPGATGIGADNFSVRWDGTLKVATTGGYQFQTVSDDGVRVWVNNVLVIDNWTYHGATTNTSSSITLTAGTNYPVRVEFFEGGGSAVMQLRWRKPADSGYSAISSCPSALSGYTLSSSGTGITCAGEQITFTAVDSSGGAIAPPSGTNVTLSTSPATGVWVGGNTYSFNGSTSSFTKYLQQTTPISLTMTITDGANSNSGTINFVDSALKFYGSSTLNLIQNQVAGIPSGNPAATNTPILKAIRTDTVTGACVAQVTGTKSVDLAYECVNPSTCVGQVLSINGSVTKANAKNASITYLSQNLVFDNTGTASIPINYNDVGRVTLHGQLSLPANGNDPAKLLVGSSDSFVVKPYTLFVSEALTPTGGSNPAATSTAGVAAGFVAGGSPFQVKVEARKFPGTAITDITPNFGREDTSESSIKLTAANLVYPSSGTLTALSGGTSFSATTPTGTWVNTAVTWDQVGSITILPELADNDYLSAGDLQIKTPSGTIGRFYPDHFSLISSIVTNSCGATFSYMGQPAIGLNYELKAQNAGGNTMGNYNANYGILPTLTYVAENANSGNGTLLSSRFTSGAALTVSAGTLQMASNIAMFSRQPLTFAPEAPYSGLQLGLDITDSFDGRNLQGKNMNAITTGVCSGLSCTAVSLGAPLDMRYGRLRLDDAFGPETHPLKVNFATEYWTGSYFAVNANDSCTQVSRTAITYPAGAISTDSNRTVNLTGGSTQGTYASLTPTHVGFNAGTAGQEFTSPNGGTGRFTVEVNLTNLSWLTFDWDQDGDYSDVSLPNATFEFGSYRGNDRIIYWREKLQ